MQRRGPKQRLRPNNAAFVQHIPFVDGGDLVGCGLSTAGHVRDIDTTRKIQYFGVQTKLLANDLVQFHVTLTGTERSDPVRDYAECAAAQYTLIRGFGFARHIRTNVGETAGRWCADAVYTVSDAIPQGLRTLDAEVVADNCVRNGIPMV